MAWHGMSGPGQRWETPADFLAWFLIISVAWSFVTAVSPWQSSRYLMAKNEHVVLRSAAVAVISIAVIQIVVFAAAGTVYLDPILMGGVISLIVVLAVSRMTVVTENERRFRLSLLVTPVEELNASEAKKTLVYALALGLFGVVMTVGMLLYYVAPYQRALSDGGENFIFNWFSGEALFAYSGAVIFVFLAGLMYRAVYRTYLAKGINPGQTRWKEEISFADGE